MSDNKNLFKEFPALSKEEWLEKVLKDLKGKPLEDLKWQLGENLTIDPFYHSDDNIQETTLNNNSATSNDWLIGEDFIVENPKETNKLVLSALENGVNAPRFIFKEVPSVETISALFQDILLAYVQTHFKIEGANPDYSTFLENYFEYVRSHSIESKTLSGSIQLADPNQKDTLQLARKLFPNFKNTFLDFSNQDTSGEKIIDSIYEILRSMDHALQQVEVDQVGEIELSISIGTSYFVEIAKIRSLKILWANLLKAYGAEDTLLSIDAYIDPKAFDENTNTNMIRSMTIAMSAVIGGTNRLTILPADQNGSSFTNRISRNVQHLLKMESYLDRVIDPAAGSFYIEKLTRLFSEQAWDKFKNT